MIKLESAIVKSVADVDLLYSTCGFTRFQRWRLLYRGSRDGFSTDSFHARCDNLSPTLTIVRTDDEHVFGGYTNGEWDSSNSYKYGFNSFLFSLRNEFRQSVTGSKIFCSAKSGPSFGCVHRDTLEHDLCIRNGSDGVAGKLEGYCSLVTKTSPKILPQFVAFSVAEIEVFQAY